ncbi:Saccharopine dehydrogenase NADP binding domain protein [compost metagenome]
MTERKSVVVYGASGYTGKLIAWHLAKAGIPFIAAGRDKSRLEAQMASIPELRKGDYECHAVDNTVDAFAKLFDGRKIVYNVAGPFMQLGEPVVQAALKVGCHYLDTTGETDWMLKVRNEYGKQFADAGLLLAPAASYMWTAGNIAAELALETPGIDTLDILYLADTATSVASTKSFLRMCTKPQYYLEHNKLVQWPYATPYEVRVADSSRLYKALPWSGGGEPLWYETDPRVRNCSTLVAFRNQAMFGAIIEALQDFERKYRHLPAPEQETITNEIGGTLTQKEPDREDPMKCRGVITCFGRSNTGGVSVVLRGNSPYLQTAAIAAEACRRILADQLLATGFSSPAKAFGARNLMSALSTLGYHTWEAQAV